MMNDSYVERFPNIAKLARRSMALEVLHDDAQPTREELIKRITDALETASYINLFIACQSIEYGQTKE